MSGEPGGSCFAQEQGEMARPERFELPTTWFEAKYSIQLSYGRAVGAHCTVFAAKCPHVSAECPSPSHGHVWTSRLPSPPSAIFPRESRFFSPWHSPCTVERNPATRTGRWGDGHACIDISIPWQGDADHHQRWRGCVADVVPRDAAGRFSGCH